MISTSLFDMSAGIKRVRVDSEYFEKMHNAFLIEATKITLTSLLRAFNRVQKRRQEKAGTRA